MGWVEMTFQDEATRLAEEYATDKESNAVSEWQKNAFLAGYRARDARIAQLESALREIVKYLDKYRDAYAEDIFPTEDLTKFDQNIVTACSGRMGRFILDNCIRDIKAISTTADRDEDGKEEK